MRAHEVGARRGAAGRREADSESRQPSLVIPFGTDTSNDLADVIGALRSEWC